MISKQARNSFDLLFQQAIRNGMTGMTVNSCEFKELSHASDIRESKMVMLTVSSYLFRLFFLIHFTPDQNSRDYFARINSTPAEAMNDAAMFDLLAEFGNLSCGILNRDLNQFFPHTGMSTPNFIERNCIAHLEWLGCSHIRHYEVRLDDAFSFHASFGICDYDKLDFSAAAAPHEAVTGELELF